MERWPVVYDSAELEALIANVRDFHEHTNFFDTAATVARRCQGDIITLSSGIPLIDQSGHPGVTPHQESLWLITGNSCDFERDLTDLLWTQMVPIHNLHSKLTVSRTFLPDLKSYRMSRYFYVPDWAATAPYQDYMAELAMPVTIHKQAVLEAQLMARMSRSAWVLLHACLVRFLARDDGRFAA